MQEATIVACPHCGAKNRVPANRTDAEPICGRCRQPLHGTRPSPSDDSILVLRCSQCRAKNRVPAGKLQATPKCGRCAAPLQHRDVLSGRAVLVTDANFEETVLRSPLPVLLYSWAPWCSVCSSTTPMVDEIASETRGKVRVGKLNTQTSPRLASQYNILSVPTFFIFDAGEMREQIPGAIPKHELLLKLARLI